MIREKSKYRYLSAAFLFLFVIEELFPVVVHGINLSDLPLAYVFTVYLLSDVFSILFFVIPAILLIIYLLKKSKKVVFYFVPYAYTISQRSYFILQNPLPL